MLEEIKKHLAGYEIEPITKLNFTQVFEVYDTNQDFFQLVQGKRATIEISTHDINALPPNCDIGQKIYVGIWKDGQVAAVLDVIERFPEPTSFWIGLLLVHGEMHGRQIGSTIVDAVLNAAKISGYKTAQLGVIEHSVKGIAFWHSHGFVTSRQSGNIVVMAKCILPYKTQI